MSSFSSFYNTSRFRFSCICLSPLNTIDGNISPIIGIIIIMYTKIVTQSRVLVIIVVLSSVYGTVVYYQAGDIVVRVV